RLGACGGKLADHHLEAGIEMLERHVVDHSAQATRCRWRDGAAPRPAIIASNPQPCQGQLTSIRWTVPSGRISLVWPSGSRISCARTSIARAEAAMTRKKVAASTKVYTV